jgi:uncharacterized membrane protein
LKIALHTLVGLVAGAIVSVVYGTPGLATAIVFAVIGGLIGWRVMRDEAKVESPPARTLEGSGAGTLVERVARLEAEVAWLKGQLADGAVPRPVSEPSQGVTRPADGQPAGTAVAPKQPERPDFALPPLPAAIARPFADKTDSAFAITPQASPLPSNVEAVTPRPEPARPVETVGEGVVEPAVKPAVEPTVKPVVEPAVEPRRAEPDPIDRAFLAAKDWLLGGNSVVRIGIIVLLFGVAFLIKYAADNSLLPVEFRLAGVAAGATVMLVTGWRVGARKGAYGLVLQGGGVGILYLVVFAAGRLYGLLPVTAALAVMIAVCALSACLAVLQNARSLAFMGSAGGFLAPILLSSGTGNHVVLFSYYAILNAGILSIAWFKAWRELNLLGFVFTFSIGAAWGVTAYRPELLASTEPFLILFFLIYVGIGLLYGVRREIALKHYVDGTLVFGTPIIAASLQAALMRDVPFGLAWSAAALAAFYLGVAAWLKPRRARLGMLFDAMLALAVIFATLAVPFAFSGPTTSAAWAIEGAAIVWVGVRQRRFLPVGFGIAMQLLAACMLVPSFGGIAYEGGVPVFNGTYLATLMIALAGLFTGWWLHCRSEARAWHAGMAQWGLAASVWGLVWWLGGGIGEILRYSLVHFDGDAPRFQADAILLFMLATAWLAHGTRRRLQWPLAEWPALALSPVLTMALLRTFDAGEAPLSGLGTVAWPLAFVGAYALMWRQQRDVGDRLMAPLHTLTFWNLCGALALQIHWSIHAFVPEGAWSWSAWAYAGGLLLLVVSGAGARLRWPVMRFARAYQLWGAMPLAALLWGWSVASVQSNGDASPLFWLPVLNPLDVAQMLAAFAIFVWWRRVRALAVEQGIDINTTTSGYVVLATVFLWFNALMLRTLHHYFHAAYDINAVFASFGWQQVFVAGWCLFIAAGLRFARGERFVRTVTMASVPVIAVMWLWCLYVNVTQDGGTWARLPLLNPLDLVQAAVYGLAAWWLVKMRGLDVPVGAWRAPIATMAGATAFLWLNAVLLRTLSHWAGIPYAIDNLMDSMLVQATVSVFWTVCALFIMLWATRRAVRVLWFVGGALLAVTVVKLFIFDLSHVQGIERIVSFIGIGILLLLIGYISPLPPRKRAMTEEKT